MDSYITKIFFISSIFFLNILFFPIFESAAEKQSQSDDLYQKVKIIYESIEKLESGNIPQQQEAFEKLCSMGTIVLPFLSSHLKNKAIFLELTRQIIEQGYSKDKSAVIFTVPLHNIAYLSSETAFVEKYFYGRYLQALRLFEKENYEEAKQLSMAILAIEKNLSFKNQLQLLKIQCEEMIIQRNLLKASLILTPREGLPICLYEIGDKVNLTLKLQNVSLFPLEIVFGEKNFIAFNVNSNLYDPFGNFNNQARLEEIPLKINSLKLNPAEEKKWEIVLDTSRDNPNSSFYRTYSLYTEIRPEKIKGEVLEKKIGTSETIRKIVSPTVVIKVFPPDVEPVLKNPLEKLEKALKGGIPLDIFLCSLLVSEPDQPKAIELLIKALEQPSAKDSNEIEITQQVWDLVIMNCLKHITNLPFEINKNTWLDWFKQKK